MEIDLEEKLPPLPEATGVYIFKNREGDILYIGKAKSLKKRLSFYFSKKCSTNSKISNMMNKAKYLEFIVTSNEKDALLLESNLIKRFKPRYNVVLRDDKRYPCLKIDLREPYPRFVIARKMQESNGVLYFGPFPSASSLRNTLRLINKVFKLRSCKNIPKNKRPCLAYQIGRCIAPCKGSISEQEYMELVKDAILFLEGKGKELIQKLTNNMLEAADRLEFEKAAHIRDQIEAIKKVMEKQHMISLVSEDIDVIGIAYKDEIYQLVVLMIRQGYMIGSRNFTFKEKDCTASEILEAFLKQYYLDSKNPPDQIIIPFKIEDMYLISSMISESSGHNVSIICDLSDSRRELIEMANRNAEQALISSFDMLSISDQLKNVLHLKKTPKRIEAIDISQIKGKQRVGSIIVFLDGKPYKDGYRNFKIEGDYVDDYSMMAEVMRRRIRKKELPELFIIDGGKAHLYAIKKVLMEEGVKDVPDIIAIAKSHNGADKIYIDEKKAPLVLPSDHPVLLFIMKIRDEAHRRAITYHRNLRSKEEIGSILTNIPGIGKKKATELLKKFKDISEIAKASVEDIAKVSGIGIKTAKQIKEYIK